MKDFINIDCCLNCKAFAFWDGDYVCTMQMKIHQYGMKNHSYISQTWMNKDIENTMQTSIECKDYQKDSDNWFILEYQKYLKWKKLLFEHNRRIQGKSLLSNNIKSE